MDVKGNLQRKNIKIFKIRHLNLDLMSKLKTVNFLDVTFDLNTDTRQPNRKSNIQSMEINNKSDQNIFANL